MTTYNDVPHGGKSFHGTSTSQGAVDGKYIVDGAEEKQTSWSVNKVPNVTVPTPGEPEFSGDITINTTGTGYHDHSEIFARLDAIEAKLDHLLEHAHQPYEGSITLNAPPKVPSGKS